MKKNKILLMASVACTFMLTFCSDLLDLYPEDSLSDPKFWASVQDLELCVNGFCGVLPGAQGPDADDESDCYVSERPKTWILNLGTIPTSGGGWGSGDWGNIRSYNYFMDRYKRVQDDEEQMNHSVAVVRFLRAWEYVYKVKHFGGVPWYETGLQMSSEQPYKGRNSRKTVFTCILEDPDLAIEHLPEPNETKIGNMHKYAAPAFRSEACLYEASFRKYHGLGDYKELYRGAAEATEQVVEKDGYAIYKTSNLTLDYYNLFVQEDLSSNSECIMPKVYITKPLMHNGTRQMEESYTDLSRAIFEQYLCADGPPTTVSPEYGEADIPMDELMRRDLHLYQTIDSPELPFKVLSGGTRQFNASPVIDTRYRTTGYYVMKYHSTDPEQRNIRQSTLDVFIFRYTEVLSNYAEAKAELGGCTQDILDLTINELRDHVEMPHLKVNIDFTDPNWPDHDYELSPLLHEIRRKRAAKLVGEGFRWDNIARWRADELLGAPKSMPGMKVSNKPKEQYDSFSWELTEDNLLIICPDRLARKWDDKPYLHPLPIDETTMNPDLLPNNPGWE